ncbi:hypothetical protein AB0G04_41990 [Actinoplanes sp. NPDC023801]|uniref:hypothetical protein n=1 Tax=Actinoplanes sp. NPDC023801 TaxID=3154595 RepID=UPI00340E9E9E
MTTDIATDLTYGLARPRVADLRACILHSPGGPQLWSQLCQAAAVPADTDDPAVLAALVAAARKATTGTVRVAVVSLGVRLRAHTALTAG